MTKKDIPYSNREIKDHRKAVTEKLDSIHKEVIKTNGSVAAAHKKIAKLQNWRSFLLGAWVVVNIIILPTLGILVYEFIQVRDEVKGIATTLNMV